MHGAVVVPLLVGKEGVEVCLKLDEQGQWGGNISDLDRHGGGWSRKLNNFHGSHMCIIPTYLCI